MATTPIDWTEIHRRIDAAGSTIAGRAAHSPEKSQGILRQRAEILAREKEPAAVGEHLEIVEFLLANERYGLEWRWVREVYPLQDFTPLPGVPAFVFGLVNVRGRILSVIDIKKFFDMPDHGISDLNKIIILADDVLEFGILADAILGVRSVAVAAIGPPLPTFTGIRREFLKGITGERLAILDGARILADKNIVVHQEV